MRILIGWFLLYWPAIGFKKALTKAWINYKLARSVKGKLVRA